MNNFDDWENLVGRFSPEGASGTNCNSCGKYIPSNLRAMIGMIGSSVHMILCGNCESVLRKMDDILISESKG